MISFSFWVAFILLSIIAIPVAASLDKRKLKAQLLETLAEAEEPAEAMSEAEAEIEEPVASVFDVEVDGTETRQADILNGLGGDDMISQFPDFDLAYLNAACPGGAAEVGSANLTLMKTGVASCVRKSWLLGRISCYWMVKGDADKAFQFGVQSLLAAEDVAAQDVTATVSFLQLVFSGAKQKDLAAKLETMQLGAEGPVDAKQMKKLAKKMGNRKSKAAISDAAARLFAKGL